MGLNFQFDVSIYGNFEKISPVLSKARVRIFYTGLNRNFTYITEEFAEKLLSTLPYSPVVGKFTEGDFSDHGKNDEQLQVYGVVPEEPNIKWELHTDKDGIERNYACADVLLWTARFSEANFIVDKAQSMELYPKSVKGQWKYKEGIKYFEFTDGCFLGLTALGDNVEPCFEGAAFYEYSSSLKELVSELKKYNLNNKEGGNSKMAFEFKLSDDQKKNAIFRLVNPQLETEGYITYLVCDVYDDYALCYNWETESYERFYYTKNDEDDSVTIDHSEKAYVLDVNETEYEALKRMSEAAETYAKYEEEYNTIKSKYEAIDTDAIENYQTTIAGLEEEKTTYTNKISELETQISEYETKVSDFTAQVEALNNQVQELSDYKLDSENTQKEELLSKYTAILPEEIVANFKESIKDYTVEDFKKELALSAIENNASTIFNHKHNDFVPNDNFGGQENCSGAQRLVNKYSKAK